ncbi:uncharacterized protein BROUX77_001607 [Berkeleyomyces rouxiae]|uniref:uncharacterized protein n=1 Tax=Berkeleyomyces rouxiae TaxID=2035830 RepID=UPI003B7B17BA
MSSQQRQAFEKQSRMLESRRKVVEDLILPLLEAFEAKCAEYKDELNASAIDTTLNTIETMTATLMVTLLNGSPPADATATRTETTNDTNKTKAGSTQAQKTKPADQRAPPTRQEAPEPKATYAGVAGNAVAQPATTKAAQQGGQPSNEPKQSGEWEAVSSKRQKKRKRAAAKSSETPSPEKRVSKPEVRQDDRIFVRLVSGSDKREADSFIVTNQLRALSDSIKGALLGAYHIRTGFALKPRNAEGRAALLEQSEAIKEWFGPGTTIDKASVCDAYIVGPVNRYISLGSAGSAEVTPDMIAECFEAATKATPEHVSPSYKGNEATFVVKIPAEGTKVPRQIRMGSRLILTRLLLERPKAQKQCTKCFAWHNEKLCARAQLCRHCGSSEHASDEHPTCCTVPHECVSKCIICRGPHPADDPECPLRNRNLSAQEKRETRTAQQEKYVGVRNEKCGKIHRSQGITEPETLTDPPAARQETSVAVEDLTSQEPPAAQPHLPAPEAPDVETQGSEQDTPRTRASREPSSAPKPIRTSKRTANRPKPSDN